MAIETYIVDTDQGQYEVDIELPDTEPTTVAGKASKILKDTVTGTLNLPFPNVGFKDVAEPLSRGDLPALGASFTKPISDPILQGDVAGTYYALMPRGERAVADFKQDYDRVIGDTLSSGKGGYFQREFPNTVGSLGALASLSMGFAPMEPSNAALASTPKVLKSATQFFPKLRRAKVVETGLEKTTRGLGQEGLLQSEVGANVKSNIPVITEIPTYKDIKPSFQETFKPNYEKFAKSVSPEPVPMTKSGEVIKKGYVGKLKKLKSAESEAFKPLEENNALKDAPAKLENSRTYLEDLFKRNDINETNAQGIPLSTIREQFPNYTPPQTPEIRSGMGEIQPTQSSSNIGIFSRILRMAGREDLTANDIKMLRTDVGYEIDKANGWNAPRTNEPIFRLKELYKKLSDDYLQAAEGAGLKDQVLKANESTRNLYGYLEKPSSEIIGKSDYSSQLQRRLIDSKTPERINELFKEHDLSPNDINVVRRGVLDELFRKSEGDPVKFGKEWNKNTPEVKKALMGDKANLVDAISDVQIEMERISKINETGKLLNKKLKDNILNSDAYKLDQKFGNIVDSEVVDTILKDGTPELADQLIKNLDKNSVRIVRRGIINRLIEKSKTEGAKGSKLNYDDINRNFNSLDDEFINTMFGEDSKTVKAIKDASKQFDEDLVKAGIGRSLPSRTGVVLQWIKGLYTRYKIAGNVSEMVERTQGRKLARDIVPNIPTLGAIQRSKNFNAIRLGKQKFPTASSFPVINRQENK